MAELEVFDLMEWYQQQTPPTSEEENDALVAEMQNQIMSHIDNGDAVVLVDGSMAKIAFKIPAVTNDLTQVSPPFATVWGLTTAGGEGNGSVT